MSDLISLNFWVRFRDRLALAAEAIDCAVLDHLVFGGGDCSSLRQLGYL